MQNRELEKIMQQKMDELKFVPSDAVWDKVEAGLPKKEKKRRWIFFILFFAALLFGSLLWFNKTVKHVEENKYDITVAKINNEPKTIAKHEGENKEQPVNGTMLLNQPAVVSAADNATVQTSAFAFKIKTKKGTIESLDTTSDDNLAGNDQKKLKMRVVLKATIKAPVQYGIEYEKNEDQEVENEETTTLKKIYSTDTALIAENKTGEKIITNADSLTANKKDTVKVIVANKEAKKKKQEITKWEYGIYMAAGCAAVTNKLFNNSPVFADVNSRVSSPASPTTQPAVNITPANPAAAVGFGIGFFAGKHISNKWKFATGINYIYQSNAVKVGSKVDSAATFNFELNKSISASNYYLAGNASSYKNKFHLIEIPVLFQFNFSGRSAFYLEAGPTISYLLQSNALVYNASSSSYITDEGIFNRLLLSANAGVGINIFKKSKLPFSVGYQFKYTAVSVVKNSFGKQHFVNSLFYLKVPLKK
jgi:hypothetical protein